MDVLLDELRAVALKNTVDYVLGAAGKVKQLDAILEGAGLFGFLLGTLAGATSSYFDRVLRHRDLKMREALITRVGPAGRCEAGARRDRDGAAARRGQNRAARARPNFCLDSRPSSKRAERQ
jgi:hypothetical protein